jgi:hypothetical protein
MYNRAIEFEVEVSSESTLWLKNELRPSKREIAGGTVRTIEFCGSTWIVADSSVRERSPGPNYFSSSSENV